MMENSSYIMKVEEDEDNLEKNTM